MKDSILNAALSAYMMAAVLLVAFQPGDVPTQTALAQATAVSTIEKTVVTGSRQSI